MGRNVEDFATYALLTDEKVMTGPDVFVNDSNEFERYTFFDAWANKREIQATAEIKDYIELDKVQRSQWLNANHKWELKGRDGMSEYSIGWAVLGNYLTYEDEEIQMNEADRKAMYKRLYKQKVVQMHTETADRLEASLWADPVEQMESVGPDEVRQPYSIPALITPNGTAASGFTSSTKFGIDPSVKTNWKNKDFTFTDFKGQVESRLFRAYHQCKFDPPKGVAQGSFTGTPNDKRIIYTDLRSMETLRDIMRESNESFSRFGQFDMGLTYDGRPIVWAPSLGSSDTTLQNQRMFLVNWDWLYPICRAGYFMKLHTAPYGGAWKPYDMPRSNVIFEYTEVNMWPRSLRRQAVIRHASNTW